MGISDFQPSRFFHRRVLDYRIRIFHFICRRDCLRPNPKRVALSENLNLYSRLLTSIRG